MPDNPEQKKQIEPYGQEWEDMMVQKLTPAIEQGIRNQYEGTGAEWGVMRGKIDNKIAELRREVALEASNQRATIQERIRQEGVETARRQAEYDRQVAESKRQEAQRVAERQREEQAGFEQWQKQYGFQTEESKRQEAQRVAERQREEQQQVSERQRQEGVSLAEQEKQRNYELGLKRGFPSDSPYAEKKDPNVDELGRRWTKIPEGERGGTGGGYQWVGQDESLQRVEEPGFAGGPGRVSYKVVKGGGVTPLNLQNTTYGFKPYSETQNTNTQASTYNNPLGQPSYNNPTGYNNPVTPTQTTPTQVTVPQIVTPQTVANNTVANNTVANNSVAGNTVTNSGWTGKGFSWGSPQQKKNPYGVYGYKPMS